MIFIRVVFGSSLATPLLICVPQTDQFQYREQFNPVSTGTADRE